MDLLFVLQVEPLVNTLKVFCVIVLIESPHIVWIEKRLVVISLRVHNQRGLLPGQQGSIGVQVCEGAVLDRVAELRLRQEQLREGHLVRVARFKLADALHEDLWVAQDVVGTPLELNHLLVVYRAECVVLIVFCRALYVVHEEV